APGATPAASSIRSVAGARTTAWTAPICRQAAATSPERHGAARSALARPGSLSDIAVIPCLPSSPGCCLLDRRGPVGGATRRDSSSRGTPRDAGGLRQEETGTNRGLTGVGAPHGLCGAARGHATTRPAAAGRERSPGRERCRRQTCPRFVPVSRFGTL